jgi:hypothetical protein
VDIPSLRLFRAVAFSECKAASREKLFSPGFDNFMACFFWEKENSWRIQTKKFVKKKNET